jgi:hypothetical protein
LVLSIILHLLLDALEYSDSGRVIVHPSCGFQCFLDDGNRWNKIMSESVVESTLELKDVLDALEEFEIAFGEGLEGLLAVSAVGRAKSDCGCGEGYGETCLRA